MERTYNGWTNYETWNAALWMNNGMGLDFTDEVKNFKDLSTLADYIEKTFTECLGTLPESGFMADMINRSLGEIDWKDIAGNAVENAGMHLSDDDRILSED